MITTASLMTIYHVALTVLEFIAGLVITVEGVNKLLRAQPYMPHAPGIARLVVALKIAGWYALTLGAAGAAATTFLPGDQPTTREVLVITGFALLIVRSRLREEVPTYQVWQQSVFDRRQSERRHHDDVHA